MLDAHKNAYLGGRFGFFFCSGEGKGESRATGRVGRSVRGDRDGGEVGSQLKTPGGGGSPRRARGPGECLLGFLGGLKTFFRVPTKKNSYSTQILSNYRIVMPCQALMMTNFLEFINQNCNFNYSTQTLSELPLDR